MSNMFWIPDDIYDLLCEETKLQWRELYPCNNKYDLIWMSLVWERTKQWRDAWNKAQDWEYGLLYEWISKNKSSNSFYLDMMCNS